MSHRQAADALVGHLARQSGLGHLALASDGSLALRIDGRFIVHLQADDEDGTLTLFAPVGTVRVDNALATCKDMLRANRFWRGTGGATLSLDAQEPPRAVLCEKVRCDAVSNVAFQALFERFVHNAGEWFDVLADGGSAAAAPAAAAGALDFAMGGLRA